MTHKTKHTGKRCRFSDQYLRTSSNPKWREETAKHRGTIQGRDDYTNFVVAWDDAEIHGHWSPNCIEILP